MYFGDMKAFDVLEFRRDIPTQLRSIEDENAIKFISQ